MIRSMPAKNEPPFPPELHRWCRSACAGIHQMRYAIESATAQIANLRTKRRTKPIGPTSASTAATAPNTSFQSHTAWKPNSLSHSRPAAVAITISSKIAQPRHWRMFRPVARYEPRRPSGARCSTIVGTRASAPMSPATASIPFPIRPPTSVAASAVRNGKSKYAGRTSTSSEMPRFVQSSVVSSDPSTRRRSGTGSIPQLGVSCKVAGRVPTAVTRALVVLAALVALVATGCGSKPKPVTKAQYEARLQTLGQDLTRAGSRIGKRIDISGFNEDIANFQDHLRAAANALHGVKPPPTARAANKRLADAFDELAVDFEPVKEARRKSIVEARKAADIVRQSAASHAGRAPT